MNMDPDIFYHTDSIVHKLDDRNLISFPDVWNSLFINRSENDEKKNKTWSSQICVGSRR